MPVLTITNLEMLQNTARDWLTVVKKRPPNGRARVVALLGDLGAGKTTFVQAVARELAINETVTSPTFVIEKVYHLSTGEAFEHLIHLDCYRLDSANELQQLGWEELLVNERNLILIEWADKVAAILPPDHLTIHFQFVSDNVREISYDD